MKHLNLTLIALLLSFASFAIGPVTGIPEICSGSTTTLADVTPGGTWSSSNPIIASVDLSGDVTGGTPGTATIIYTAGGATATLIVTVMPVPSIILGAASVCAGASITLSDVGGGIWSSSDVTIATIGPATGIVSGVSGGPAIITYALPTGCAATTTVSVTPLPAAISGTLSVCLGGTTTLSDATTGGFWSSGNTAVATIDPFTGIIATAGMGTSAITYNSGCSVTVTVSVNPGPATITGPTSACAGSTVTLADAIVGGSWTSSNTFVAAIDPVTGVLTASSSGTTLISYSTGTGCAATLMFTVYGAPYAGYSVIGGGNYCTGGPGVDITLDGSSPFVDYQLFSGGVVLGTPISGTGAPLDFGLFTTAGTYSIIATNTVTGCSAAMSGSASITVSPSPNAYPVTGGGAYCAGGTGFPVGLASSDGGITYQLYDGASPVGAPLAGVGAALSFGTLTTAGTYSITAVDPSTGCASAMTGSATITVNALPTIYTVSGGGTYCSGTSGLDISLSGSTTGVNYQLLDGGVAAGAPMAGTGSSLDLGLQTAGTYTVIATNATTGCTRAMTGSAVVTPTLLTPTVSVSRAPSGLLCNGTSVTFTATPVNGGAAPAYAWSVNSAATGTGNTYTYVPATGDMVSVVLTSSLPCASPLTGSTADTLTVITPAITATSTSVCGGSDTLFAGGGRFYSWAPATGVSCTTCDAIVVDPTATVTYTLTGTDSNGCVGTATITANGNRISGHVNVGSSTGAVRVWLIQYSPADSSLTAIDSTMACTAGGMPYYEFDGNPAGSYIVKANVLGGTPGASGFIPTYGLSSAIWTGAANIVHASGTDTMHVDMLYGIVPPGPGFIGGTIVSGAGRGTSTGIPAPGLLVYLKDAASGDILTYTYTNTLGQYSFGDLANSSYIVYPELFDYYTMPAYVVTLTTTNESVNDIDFKQHTSNNTITPYIIPALVKPLSNESGLNIYPNPTSGNLSIQWSNQATGSADVVVTDIAGRDVYKSAININAASGQAQIDLGSLTNGIYIISVRSANNNYNGKLMIQQ